MRIFGFALILISFAIGFSLPAHAKKDTNTGSSFVGKLFSGYWGDKIWEGQDFQPYLADQPIKNRIVWDRDNWTPQDWIDDVGGDARYVMRDLFGYGILTRQYRDGEIPVLEVGEPYLRLSHTDRLRVLRFVDHIFEITKEPNGMFFVYLKDVDDEPLGTYGNRGFQHY
jgi:hypothetical protein